MLAVAIETIGSCDDNIARFLLNMHAVDIRSQLMQNPNMQNLMQLFYILFANKYIAHLTMLHKQQFQVADEVEVYIAYYIESSKKFTKPPFQKMFFLICAYLSQENLDHATQDISNLLTNKEFFPELNRYLDFDDLEQTILALKDKVNPSLDNLFSKYQENLKQITERENLVNDIISYNETYFYTQKLENREFLWSGLRSLAE